MAWGGAGGLQYPKRMLTLALVKLQKLNNHNKHSIHNVVGTLKPWEGPAVVLDGSLLASTAPSSALGLQQSRQQQQQHQQDGEEVWEMLQLQGMVAAAGSGGAAECEGQQPELTQHAEAGAHAEKEHQRADALQVKDGLCLVVSEGLCLIVSDVSGGAVTEAGACAEKQRQRADA